jgi:hypothetical protein
MFKIDMPRGDFVFENIEGFTFIKAEYVFAEVPAQGLIEEINAETMLFSISDPQFEVLRLEAIVRAGGPVPWTLNTYFAHQDSVMGSEDDIVTTASPSFLKECRKFHRRQPGC